MYKTINLTKTADPLPVFINCLIFYEPPFFLAKKYVTPPPPPPPTVSTSPPLLLNYDQSLIRLKID
jgi:hypothetical protein